MKNKKVWKIFGLALFITFVLSWIIPSTTIGSDGLTTGSITPTGYADIFATFDIIVYYFAKPSILILLVGAFYGIINRTGAFKALVEKLASIFSKKGWIFLSITAVFYAITTALSGMYLPMIMFMPLSIAVLLELKYNKLDSILATAGASTIGLLSMINSASISSMTGATSNTYIWVKVGLLVVLTALIILYIIFVSKKKKIVNSDEDVIFELENRKSKIKHEPKFIGLLIIFALLFVISVLGFTPWNETVATAFSNAYTAIKNVTIGNFAIFDKVLGYFETFGSWTYASLYPTIAFAMIVSVIIGKIKFSEAIEAIADGLKKFSGIALLVALMNIILIFTLNSGFVATIVKLILAKENVALVTISSLLGNVFMVDETYSAQYILSLIYYGLGSPETSVMELYGLICQFTFGFVSLVAPSSVLLLSSLYYVGEDYKKWLKYIWKLLLAIFVAMLIAVLVSALI